MSELVAVYGSLREGFGNHSLLGDSQLKSEEVLEGEYTMLHLGGFPGVVLEGTTPITVEVYEIDEDTFSRLDMLEGYPSFYNRKQVETRAGMAWIYYLHCNDEWTNTFVPSGDWADR